MAIITPSRSAPPRRTLWTRPFHSDTFTPGGQEGRLDKVWESPSVSPDPRLSSVHPRTHTVSDSLSWSCFRESRVLALAELEDKESWP